MAWTVLTNHGFDLPNMQQMSMVTLPTNPTIGRPLLNVVLEKHQTSPTCYNSNSGNQFTTMTQLQKLKNWEDGQEELPSMGIPYAIVILTKDTTILIVRDTEESALHTNRSNLVAYSGEVEEDSGNSENSDEEEDLGDFRRARF